METSAQIEKLKDAFHYVIARVGARAGFGATKLYKVLWFAEARSFVLTGSPIFGTDFIREKHGPVPRDAMRIRGELVSEGRAKIWRDSWHNRNIWRFKALTDPQMEKFSSAELETLNFWIKHIDEDHTAESISEESHDYGWEIAKLGEVLPVHAFLAQRLREPTLDELKRAQRRFGHLGI